MHMTEESVARQVAEILLNKNAVKLNAQQPFTWASGWKSPIYCDNRTLLSYPEARTYIKQVMANMVRHLYPDAEMIAGVATGAISWGVLVADELQLPFVYVRPKPKDHGLENLVEGFLPEGAKTVVIEDLISTGGSSVKAVQALRDRAAQVKGLIAVYTHGFEVAETLFKEANCPMTTLSRYEYVIEEAIRKGYIEAQEHDILKEWRLDPANWKR